jgi:UDP:flavonoid glycosyltransferase YjiC (YdhE family)
MLSQKRILVSPLNWGLGHATRCIPIIRLLIKKNATVIIAAEGRPLALLQQEFPNLEFIHLKGAAISYPNNGSMILKMILSIPKIIGGIISEHRALKKIIIEKKIDVVISDNRFGLWNKDIKSIFITHQMMIKSPFAEKLLHRIHLFFIKKYDECWIPDIEGPINFSGDLSHKFIIPNNAFFIGIQSRFNNEEPLVPGKSGYDVMAIISGPEPQRSIFEKLILQEIKQTSLKALVVCGKTDISQKTEFINNIEVISHLSSEEMETAILRSKIIISRSGYSTVMDLATLGKKAVFIPTPGQTEQEYLAKILMQKKIAFFQNQGEFNLQKALKEIGNYNGFEISGNDTLLEKRIENLLILTQRHREHKVTQR